MFGKWMRIVRASSFSESLPSGSSNESGVWQPHVTHEEKAKREKSIKARKAAKKARRANRRK